MRRPLVIIITSTLCLSCVLHFLWCGGFFGTYDVCYKAGTIQIVAGPHEAWCFLEIDRVVHRPGPLVEPPRITLGHIQEVVVLTADGVKERIQVSENNGVTFHPNISYIFRRDNNFYLYEDFSMGTHRSVYRWRNNHFELLPLHKSEAFLREQGLDQLGLAGLEQKPSPNDWSRVHEDRGWYLAPSRFDWNGLEFEIEAVEDEGIARWEIRRLGEGGWTAELAQYETTRRPISRREHEAFWNESKQRGHPRP